MTIIRYHGKFNKDGSIAHKTRVEWKCDGCERVFDSRNGAYAQGSGFCAWCAKHGKPLTAADAIALYPAIGRVLTFGKRGGVHYDSKVEVACRICGEMFETLYRHVVTRTNGWRCQSCGKVKDKGKITLPADLPEYIKRVNEETLGSLGRVMSHTILFMDCPRCGKEVAREWHIVKSRGNTVCRSCNIGIRWEDEEYRRAYSEMISNKWKTPEFRNKEKASREGYHGNKSKLHASIKDALLDKGITGFESERYIGDSRVDEVDFARRIVIEVYGDYWHLNPLHYNADDVVSRGGNMLKVSDQWTYDNNRIENIVSAGYSVYIIWEAEFKSNPKEAIEMLSEWISTVATVDLEVI